MQKRAAWRAQFHSAILAIQLPVIAGPAISFVDVLNADQHAGVFS